MKAACDLVLSELQSSQKCATAYWTLRPKWLLFFKFLVTAVSGRPKPEICPLLGRFWVNILAQGVLRKFTQWPWIEHPSFQLRGGHFTTELMPTWLLSYDKHCAPWTMLRILLNCTPHSGVWPWFVTHDFFACAVRHVGGAKKSFLIAISSDRGF